MAQPETITLSQADMNRLMAAIGEMPTKFGMPVVDVLREFAARARATVPPIPLPPGEPMQQQPSQLNKPASALDLARYQVPGGAEIRPDGG